MSHTRHELLEQFAEDAPVVHRLKVENPHFAALSGVYHELNRTIHRIETEVEAASDERVEALKRHRLSLLDELGALIANAREAG
jgi:uncharacterized protein YdcH (DUF465 family)